MGGGNSTTGRALWGVQFLHGRPWDGNQVPLVQALQDCVAVAAVLFRVTLSAVSVRQLLVFVFVLGTYACSFPVFTGFGVCMGLLASCSFLRVRLFLRVLCHE